MALKAGSLKKENNYAGSMAEAIEHAFQEEWPHVMGGEKPKSNPQMKLLFIAIAQGVVKYLSTHSDSFEVEVQEGGNAGKKSGKVSEIVTTGVLH